ncbi:MAG: hypothetical protein U9R27_11905 [Campylobacterota bacterium]|nr:hypothetical protein [Campylobacterota bacterium]
MYNVDSLEIEWKKYRSKKRIPWYIFLISVLLIVGYSIYREEVSTLLTDYMRDHNISWLEEANKSQLSKPDIPPIKSKSELNTTANIESNGSVQKARYPMMMIETGDRLEGAAEKEHKRKYLKIEVTDRYPKKTSSDKAKNSQKKKKSIKDVEKKFSKSKSYHDSLFLARAYYEKGQYDDAQKWALITNNLNSKVEESWLIFAKTKAKKGSQRESIEILKAYEQKTNSKKAKALIVKIKQGKI